MSNNFINVNEEMKWLKNHYFNGLIYRDVKNAKFIGVVRLKDHSIWFECFDELETDTYSYSSQSLVDCCEYLGIPYYNYK